MNSFEEKLIEKFPWLYKGKILNMLKEHNDILLKNGFHNPHRKLTNLESLIIKGSMETITKFIESNNLDFFIDNFTPREILNNQLFIEYLIRKNPRCIYALPNELITSRIFEIFENSIISDNNEYSNLIKIPMPKIFYQRDKIIEYCLHHTPYYDYPKIMNDIFLYRPDFIDRAIDIGFQEKAFMPAYFYEYNSELIANSKFVHAFEYLDVDDVLKIFKMNPKLAKEIFVELINNNKLKASRFNYSTDKEFFKDKEIIDLLLKSNIRKNFNFNNIDVSYFSDENIKQMLEEYEHPYEFPKNFFNSVKCLDLAIRLNKMRIVNSFEKNIFDKYFFNLNVSTLEKESLISLLNLFNVFRHEEKINSSVFLKEILVLREEKVYNDFFTLEPFSLSSFSDENLELLIKLQKKGIISKNINTFVSENFLSDKRIFNYLLKNYDNENLQYLLAFSSDVFDEQNIKEFINRIDNIDSNIEVSPSICKRTDILQAFLNGGYHDPNFINKFYDYTFDSETMNMLFKKLPFEQFMELNCIKDNFNKLLSLIDIDEESFKIKMSELININRKDNTFISISLWFLKESIERNPNANINLAVEKTSSVLMSMGYDRVSANEYIKKVLNGNRNPSVFLNVIGEKSFKFATYIGDFYTRSNAEYIEGLPKEIIDKVNVKHLNEVATLLNNQNIHTDDTWKMALNIYMTLGYEKTVKFLSLNPNKNYGKVDNEKLMIMFNSINLYDILFKKEGNEYVPELNEKLLNIIFGNSNKEKNTPIRNFLGDYADKKEEIENNILLIKKNLTLSEEEKQVKINEYLNQFDSYKSDIEQFFKYIGKSFNEWDIIEEEFLKMMNKSKLKIKLNPPKVVEILEKMNSARGILDEVRDAKLIESDVFDYAGYDAQYTLYPEKAPLRAIKLSREMEGKFIKKFPNVSITSDKYTIRVYNPQDRRILSAGYRSGSCFRPNGNADNLGKDNSLLRYCATTEYGGGVEIVDKEGNTIMVSPLLRNGNVLMVHSIETKLNSFPNECSVLLKDFAKKIIEESAKSGDNIEFVTITNLHNLDYSITEGSLPQSKLFSVYDPDHAYDNMYTNLDCTQMLLAEKPGSLIEDITYGSVSHDYKYNMGIYDSYQKIELNDDLILDCIELENLHLDIINISNMREEQLRQGNETNNSSLLAKIRESKKKYLEVYKKVLGIKKGRNIYQEIKWICYIISSISGNCTFNDLINYTDIMCGNDWYIAITKDGKVEYDCLDSGADKLKDNLIQLKKNTRFLNNHNDFKSIGSI